MRASENNEVGTTSIFFRLVGPEKELHNLTKCGKPRLYRAALDDGHIDTILRAADGTKNINTLVGPSDSPFVAHSRA